MLCYVCYVNHSTIRAAASPGVVVPSRRAIRRAWATQGEPYAEGSALEATTAVLLYARLDDRWAGSAHEGVKKRLTTSTTVRVRYRRPAFLPRAPKGAPDGCCCLSFDRFAVPCLQQ